MLAVIVLIPDAKPLFMVGLGFSSTVLEFADNVIVGVVTSVRPVTALVPCGWIMRLEATKDSTKKDKNIVAPQIIALNFPSRNFDESVTPKVPSIFCRILSLIRLFLDIEYAPVLLCARL